MPQTNNVNSLVSKIQDVSIVIFKVSFIYTAPYFKRVSRIIYYAISFRINKGQGSLYYILSRLWQGTSLPLLQRVILEKFRGTTDITKKERQGLLPYILNLIIFKIYFILWVYILFCMFSLLRSEESVGCPATRVIENYEQPCVCWEFILSPLGEQQVLLTIGSSL